MADTATLQARLDALEEAEFKLVAGQQATVLGYSGETVTFTPSDLNQIRSLMRRIRRELGDTTAKRPSARGFVT
ncbi:MAG: gpW family head-tail joining protein [Hoeflea sp.]|uniref:gpW family head-tail joining protein n=1 Tax=Hoeflea sp. TaxID=1940281 RepID=UPI003EF7C6FB